MIDKYEINKTRAWVNMNKFPIEGETKTYKEIKESLGWKGGNYEDYKNKKEAEKAWDNWDNWCKKTHYKYWSWGYNQWNNINFNCSRCGLFVENGTGYSGVETINEFEKEREESAEKYPRDYKSKEEVPYYLYCEVDSDLKGYSRAYVKGNIKAYWQFDGGRDGRCGSSNFCMGDKKNREYFLTDEKSSKETKEFIKSLDEKQCLTDFSWQEWLKHVNSQGKPTTEKQKKTSLLSERGMGKLLFGGKEINYSSAVLNYCDYRKWFDEWVKDKEDICKKTDTLRFENYRNIELNDRQVGK